MALAFVATPIVPSLELELGGNDAHAQRGKAKKPAKKTRKQKRIDRHMFTAQYYMLKEKDMKAAARELSKVLRLDRGHVEAGIGLAVIYSQEKKFKKAIKVLNKLAKKKPKELRVLYALARTHLGQGNDDEALSAYRRAVKIARFDRESLFQIYTLVDKKSRQNSATKDDVKSAALAFIRIETNRESYRYRMVERRLVEVSGEPIALVIYDANRAYQTAFTERRMGRINARMGDARQGYEKCIKMQPKNQRCHYGLGLVYSSVKASGHYDRNKARAAFNKASSLPESHYELGRISRLEDDFDAARSSFQKALSLRKDYGHAHLELGVVYKLEGNDGKAASHFVKAYNADRYSAAAAKAIAELAKIEPDHQLVRAGMLYGGITGDVFSTDRFRAAVSLVEKTYGGVEKDAKETVILERVLNRILAAADADSDTSMTVAVLNTPIVNAMAMPNGNIYFTRGFLDFLKKTWPDRKIDVDNDVLGHVMAHEIGHVLRKHTLNSVLFQQAYKDAGERLDGAIITHVTRLQEIEADRVGIVLASLAGFHPRGGIEFMEHQGQKHEIPTHLDHPTYEERARYLEEYWTNDVKYAYLSFELGNRALESGNKVLQLDPKTASKHYGKAIDHFSRFRDTLKPTKRVLNNLGVAYSKRGMIAYAGQSSPLERWQSRMSIEKQSALKYKSVQRKAKSKGAAPGTRGAAKRSIPVDLTKSMKLFRDALRRDANYARARVNLATVQLAVGKTSKAAKTMSKLKGSSGLVSLTRGIVHAEQGNYDKAAQSFALATKARSTRRQATYNLARAYQLGKKKDKAKRVYQRYLRKYPKGPWAAAARREMKKL